MGLTALLSLLFSVAGNAAATAPALDAGFTWSADVLSSDFRNDTLDISGNVRVTQGPASIEAQTAKARNVRAETQRWTFQDSVRIRTAEADLHSNLATAAVVNGQISNARIEGTPARFEQVSASNNRQVRGRAGVIEYDFGTGVVKLTNQVWFSNGKDEFRGDVVIYNVRDERVQINPGGSSNRVRGIIRPSQNKTPNTPEGAAGTAAILEPAFNDNGTASGEERLEPKLATESGGGA
ncbi:MAG: LptA/OstA family protein [Pseudomonadota bacterium]|nr:LptA/OstA family protein [Pseudomonadota bacterium]